MALLVEEANPLGMARKGIRQDRMGEPEEAHFESRRVGRHEDKFRAHAQCRLDRDRVKPTYGVIEHYRAKQTKLGIAFAQDLRAICGSRRMVLEQRPSHAVPEKILNILISALLALLTVGRSMNV